MHVQKFNITVARHISSDLKVCTIADSYRRIFVESLEVFPLDFKRKDGNSRMPDESPAKLRSAAEYSALQLGEV